MKRYIITLLITLMGLTAYTQETPPPMGPNFKQLSTSQFYLQLPDSILWQYKGVAYGWARLARYADLNKKYDKVISVGVGGNYTTLEALFANEPTGKTLINLTDANYNVVNPKFLVKKGWVIQGMGYGRTKINMSFTTTIDPDMSGLHIRYDCELNDLEVIATNNTNAGGFNEYALHSDYLGAFTAKINRCWFKSTPNPDGIDNSGFQGLTIGIGTWEGQTLEFHECVLQSQSVAINSRTMMNLHNTYITGTHTTPSRVSFYNSQLTGGFSTVVISDVYSNDADPNGTRIKDLFEFVGCEIKGGLWLRSHSQLGTINKKNGINYNFSGTTVDEFVNIGETIDTALPNYDITSVPVTKDIDFQKNLGSSSIVEGDFVCYVYGNRVPEPHIAYTYQTPIGVEKLSATNIKHLAGISLVNSAVGSFLHFAKSSIAYTSGIYPTFNVGDRVTFDKTGNLILAFTNGSGIGTVRKKTNLNKLGIELNINGAKSNNIGSETIRGFQIIEGTSIDNFSAPVLNIHNYAGTGANWFIYAGQRPPVGRDDGRFSIADVRDNGSERLGIDSIGNVQIGKILSVLSAPVGTYDVVRKIELDTKQNTLLSGTNIKTINGTSLLGSGDIPIVAGVSSVNTRTGAITLVKADVGLTNVDNTSDVGKPISTAAQTALNGKLSLTGGTLSGSASYAGVPTVGNDYTNKTYVDTQVSSVTIPDASASVKGKIQIAGDLAGTASAPTVPGLTLKANLASPTFTGAPNLPTGAIGVTQGAGNNSVSLATTAFVANSIAVGQTIGANTTGLATSETFQTTGTRGNTLNTGIILSKDVNYGANGWNSGHLVLKSITSPNKSLGIGYSLTDDKAYITAAELGVGLKPILIDGTSVSVPIPTLTTSATTKAYVDAADATKQNALTLTTTGTGAATLTGSTLNIPTPSVASNITSGIYTPTGSDYLGDITSINSGIGLYYLRIGNTVMVQGAINTSNNSGTSIRSFSISLPIATTAANAVGSLTGTSSGSIVRGEVNYQSAGSYLTVARCTYYAEAGGGPGVNLRISFSYTIQ